MTSPVNNLFRSIADYHGIQSETEPDIDLPTILSPLDSRGHTEAFQKARHEYAQIKNITSEMEKIAKLHICIVENNVRFAQDAVSAASNSKKRVIAAFALLNLLPLAIASTVESPYYYSWIALLYLGVSWPLGAAGWYLNDSHRELLEQKASFLVSRNAMPKEHIEFIQQYAFSINQTR